MRSYKHCIFKTEIWASCEGVTKIGAGMMVSKQMMLGIVDLGRSKWLSRQLVRHSMFCSWLCWRGHGSVL
jgi:hypothetical protein